MPALALALLACPASAQVPPPRPDDAVTPTIDAAFAAARGHYFHDLVNGRPCPRVFPDRTAALNGRYTAALRRLTQRYGAALRDRAKPLDHDWLAAGDCAKGVELDGYDRAVAAMEKAARAEG